MAVIEGAVSQELMGVGAEAAHAAHVTLKPLPHGALGHYRVNHRFSLVAAQAANSRLFELRNASTTNLIVLTRIYIKWLTNVAHTAIIEDSLDFFKVTGFTAVDTTNTVTPTASRKRTAGMGAAPGTAVSLRGITIAGIAAGMTGGTMTKDGGSAGQIARILAQTAMATTETASRDPQISELVDDPFASHPWVFGQDEGFILENRVLLGAAAGSSIYIDCSYAEVAAF